MHNSYFLLRHLGAQLNDLLSGSHLTSCFSQDKDELVVSFDKNQREEYFIHAVMRPDLNIIRAPESFARTKKNSIDLFPEIENSRVLKISCMLNERCLSIDLHPHWTLLMKMFGTRSNVILCQDDKAVVLFKKNLTEDLGLTASSFSRTFEVSKQALERFNGDFSQMLPTLSGPVKQHLERQGYWKMNPDRQWAIVEKTINRLGQPDFYIYHQNRKPVMTLFRPEEYSIHTHSALKALEQYYRDHVHYKNWSSLQKSTLNMLNRQVKRAMNSIRKSEERLNQLETRMGYREMADLIMANMHRIPSGAKEVELPDFTTGKPVKINLKPSLSPQKNAESFYRKSKNQQKEIKVLNENLRANRDRMKEIQTHLDFVTNCMDHRSLLTYVKDHGLSAENTARKAPSIFKEFNYQGYRILLGRNASNNDLLTQKHAHKEDMWLHAKDVKGSHVVIKHLPGRSIPAVVIEYAAQLAAYYSKRKHDTLCPVAYTLKKYVRKPKGAAAGQVVVDREQVILVTPENQIN